MNDHVYQFIRQGQELRKQYAYHLNEYNGLDFMLTGGVYCLIYIIYYLIGPGILMAFLMMFLTSVWTFGKGFIIQKAHLNDFETVREPVSRFKPWIVKLSVGLTTALALSLWVVLILTRHIFAPDRWPTLLIISGMPLITWRYFRTLFDFAAGFNLWLLCAIAIQGQPLSLNTQGLFSFLLFGVFPSLVGIWLYWDYHKIVKNVKELRHGYR